MRCNQVLAYFFALVFAAVSAAAGEAAAPASKDSVWGGFAGMAGELGAEDLELRDELISAHIYYMSALEAALTEIGAMRDDDPKLLLAWARVEYLLETSFRLLGSTGEHESFLKATERLKPAAAPAVDPVSLEAAPGDTDLDGGLVYENADGDHLLPTLIGGRMVLVDSLTATPVSGLDGVTARPYKQEPPPARCCVPLIQARAAWLRSLALERLGRIKEAAAETASLGLIRNWLVLGPLESEGEPFSFGNYNLDELYDSLGAGGAYPGKDGPVRWRPFVSADPLGRLFADALFRSEGTKSALALALVYSRNDGPAVMRFGSNSPALVCVNYVQARHTISGGMADPDQEAFDVWLRKGWNTILIRTVSGADGWGMAARLTSPDGTPFPGFVVKPDAANAAAILAEAGRAAKRSALERFYQPARLADLGGISILSAWLATNQDNARANFYLASLLVANGMMEGPERFDRELIFRRAMEASGNNPYFSMMAARSVDSGVEGPDREENLRLVLLKSAADQGSAAALVDMGRLYLDVMRQPRRAGEYAEAALAVNPMSLRAGVLDYDVAVAMRWKPVANSLLERLVNRHPAAAAARLRLGRAALTEGRYRQALSEFHAILGADAGNVEALDGAVLALGMLGQTSAAVDLLVSHIDRFPYDSKERLKLAELYRTLGRDEEATGVLKAALELAPDDEAALAMRRDIDRETYAEGKAGGTAAGQRKKLRQELDLSPPRQTPPNGWEYLYFQVEDRMEKNGAINRTVSFALRIYSDRAARMLRHLGFWLERDFESGTVTMLNLIQPNGSREAFTPPVTRERGGDALKFYLPPLRAGMAVEAEVEIRRERIPFLGDYFGQIAPMTQQAPVRLSRYMFTCPKDRRIFFLPVNGAPEAMVVESSDGQEVTRIWEMSNLPAFIPEPDSPGQHELMPCVQVSSFSDWNEFARWYWRLIGVQYHTPPELRTLAKNIGGQEPNPMVKLDLAAAWVARNIGHREWEYGPYAFRPINARSILSRLSADGKDRTLLLCLLAEEYGLEAWPVLSRLRNRRFAQAGTDGLSLPLLDHFNHSLVLVQSDFGGDVFLDASNPYRPPGVMPSQLFGSPGVVITPGGAEKVLVPDGGVSGCEWDETAEMEVDEDGSVIWEESLTGTGTAAEALRLRFNNPETRAEAWTAFLASLGTSPNAAADEFRDDPLAPASATFTGRARLRRLASMEDDRVILTVPALPGTMTPSSGKFSYPLSLEDFAEQGLRTQALTLPHGFKISRRITVTYPEEWHLMNQPVPFTARYSFGTLSLSTESMPGSLALKFTVEVPGHRLAAGDFPDFREMSAQARRWLQPLLVWEKP